MEERRITVGIHTWSTNVLIIIRITLGSLGTISSPTGQEMQTPVTVTKVPRGSSGSVVSGIQEEPFLTWTEEQPTSYLTEGSPVGTTCIRFRENVQLQWVTRTPTVPDGHIRGLSRPTGPDRESLGFGLRLDGRGSEVEQGQVL